LPTRSCTPSASTACSIAATSPGAHYKRRTCEPAHPQRRRSAGLNETTAQKCHTLLVAHPEALAVACDIRGGETVGQLLQHIVAVELRYAQRLAALPESDYSAVPYGSANEILSTHSQAISILRSLLEDPAFDWSQPLEFHTITMGKLVSTRKTVFIHAMMHSIRHYAQLATILRQHGIKPDWPMDYLFMNARPA
jgi:uncharacterized damage-inducible protein DinB